MRAEYIVTGDYLYLPVSIGKPEPLLGICVADSDGLTEKIYEFNVPSGDSPDGTYDFTYMAPFPVAAYLGKKLVMSGDFADAFFGAVRFGEWEQKAPAWRRPQVHAAANTGWTNDPNGMYYDGETYHLYFQYNPLNVVWQNMSWGHFTSRDLLHWQQHPAVLFPDETGTMFSGCAIRNTHGLLGLDKDAVIYFYTAAGDSNHWSRGKNFVQMIAVSTDGGRTLQKTGRVCVPFLAKENRDPKVFFHAPSDAYVMVLFLTDHDFAVLRSKDLENWELTQRLTLPDTWECPDLFCLFNEAGEPCWFFWTADGYYWSGDFDGFTFDIKSEKAEAYMNPLPYAAQTFDGLSGRTVTIPWLRLTNDGRPFTGAYGLPCELGWQQGEAQPLMTLKPVRELRDHLVCISDSRELGRRRLRIEGGEENKPVYAEFTGDPDSSNVWSFAVNGSRVSYDPVSGVFNVDGRKHIGRPGCREIALMIDDRILEVWLDGGKAYGAWELQLPGVALETDGRDFAAYRIYEIR